MCVTCISMIYLRACIFDCAPESIRRDAAERPFAHQARGCAESPSAYAMAETLVSLFAATLNPDLNQRKQGPKRARACVRPVPCAQSN